MPNAIRRDLYPSISPVNSFRVVLAALTGEPPDLLDDPAFYYEDKRPGAFVEVVADFRP